MTLQMAANAFRSGSLRTANQLCQEVLANEPTNTEAMNLMGAISGTAGRHDLAVEWMRKASQLRPSDLIYRKNYLSALLKVGRIDEANTAIAESLQLFPGDTDLLTLQGIVYGKQGDSEAAIKSLNDAIAIAPNSSAFYNLAVILGQNGETEKAVDFFTQSSRN